MVHGKKLEAAESCGLFGGCGCLEGVQFCDGLYKCFGVFGGLGFPGFGVWGFRFLRLGFQGPGVAIARLLGRAPGVPLGPKAYATLSRGHNGLGFRV